MKPKVWIEKSGVSRGSPWRVRWVDTRGRRSRMAKTKTEAEQIKVQVYRSLQAGQYGQPTDGPWNDFVRDDLKAAETSMSKGGRKRLETSFKAVTRILKPRRLSEVATFGALERFVEKRFQEPGKRGKNIQPETVVADLQYLRGALNRARRRQLIGQVPEMPKISTWEKVPQILSSTRISRLMNAATHDRERALVWLLLTTGRRLQDILHLQWQWVDLEGGLIRIVQDEEYQTKGRRNDYAHLDPYGKELLELLNENTRKKVVGGKAVPCCPWVFTTLDGKRRWTNNVRRTWHKLCKAAEFPEPYPRIHDCKHTFVSGLVAAGIQQSIITAVAAHRSSATTQKYYSWVVDDSRRQAVQALPWVMNDQSEEQSRKAEGA